MKDPLLRYPNDPGPLIPGKEWRFNWVEPGDPDQTRIREQVIEGGPGLYVVRLGSSALKALIEAYYPEDIRGHYYLNQLDPMRKSDYEMGRLVAIQVMFMWRGELGGREIQEINRNARNAKEELRRTVAAKNIERALNDARAEAEKPAYDRWNDFYSDAYVETFKHIKSISSPVTEDIQ